MTALHTEIEDYFPKELIPHLNTGKSYNQDMSTLKDGIWETLRLYTVEQAFRWWLPTLSKHTKRAYQAGQRKLIEMGLLNPIQSLQDFAKMNHEAIVDKIKSAPDWSESTKQARAAFYIAFTGFLSRRFQGLIKKASTSKEESSKTFYRVHEKVVTNAMNQAQWVSFLNEIANERDCLIAKLALQGGKRANEVLSLTTQQIAWDKREITFTQSKTKGVKRATVITYPKHVMDELRTYIGNREGLVFITKTGRPVPLIQIAKSFEKAGAKANIPFKVSPHVLRASAVTYLKQQGFSDSDIMKVTGHASAEMINAYDKSSRADNASKKVSLV